MDKETTLLLKKILELQVKLARIAIRINDRANLSEIFYQDQVEHDKDKMELNTLLRLLGELQRQVNVVATKVH